VVGSTLQIFAQIAGSLLKDDSTTWKKVEDEAIIPMFGFWFGWFIAGNFFNKKDFKINCYINISLKLF